MKVGIYNIFVGLWYLLLLICTTILFGLLFKKDSFNEISFIIIIPIISGIAALFFWGYFFYKFEILILTNSKIISYKPFLLKRNSIKYNEIKNIEWNSWKNPKMGDFIFSTIKTSDKNQIIISQAQFENFEEIMNYVYSKKNNLIPRKGKELYIEEAKQQKWTNIFAIIISISLLLFFLLTVIKKSKSVSYIHYVITALFLLILFGLFRRYFKYNSRLKKN